jgi:hypothetical protein
MEDEPEEVTCKVCGCLGLRHEEDEALVVHPRSLVPCRESE